MADRSYLHRLRTSGGPSSDLLVLLDRHRVMTTDQLARATGTPERSVRYRLERLHSHGLIECIRPVRERGSSPRHWWLRPSGARLVAGTAAAEGRPSGMYVAHTAAITEVWLAFVEHGPAAGIRVRKWLTDRAGWQEWERSGRWSSHPSRLTPDALAMLTLPDGGEAVVFVEVDLASMTQTVLKQKVARYLAYADDLVWPDRYPYCPPMLHLDAGLKIITVQQAVGRLFSSICRRRRYVVGDADLRRLLPGAPKITPSPTSQSRPRDLRKRGPHSTNCYTCAVPSRSQVLREVMRETGTTQSELSRISGVRQPSISQFLSGRTPMSDDMLDRLLSCMGYRLEVVRRAVRQDLGRSPERSWRLHRRLSMHLTSQTLVEWRPTMLRNLERLRDSIRGQPHLRNLDRWQHLIENGDLTGLRRVMTGVDTDSVQMREVSPMGGLLPQHERTEALRQAS